MQTPLTFRPMVRLASTWVLLGCLWGGSALAQANSSEIRKTAPRPASPDESVHLKPSLPAEKSASTGLSPWQTIPAAPVAAMTLQTLLVEGDATQATVTLAVDGDGRLRGFSLISPNQVIIEGDGLAFGPVLATLRLAGGLLVSDVRFGAATDTTGRLVLDLGRPGRITSFARTSDQRLVLKIAAALSATADPGEAFVVDLTAKPEPPAPPASRAPRKLVMIDPGHGGKDPGAVTDTGLYEKDVVLAVAKRLQAVLSAGQRYDVRLTREADTSVSLDRRVVMSRMVQADLFISLHADTFAGQPAAAAVRGGSVYILSERASSRLAASLAEKENAADNRLGADLGPSTGDAAVDSFLNDLTSRETQVLAADIQGGLVRSLKGAMQLARDPARGAAFKVLKQAGTPAVLIELGYMSHAQDVALLQSPDWQGQVAVAIGRAVDAYFAKTRSVVPGAILSNR